MAQNQNTPVETEGEEDPNKKKESWVVTWAKHFFGTPRRFSVTVIVFFMMCWLANPPAISETNMISMTFLMAGLVIMLVIASKTFAVIKKGANLVGIGNKKEKKKGSH